MILYLFETNFKLKNKRLISRWIKTIAKKEGKKVNYLNYIFCNDQYILKLNLKFLKHDNYTDVITFGYSSKKIYGDSFISVERLVENSFLCKQDIKIELRRVLVHSLLHLFGYKDKTKSQKRIMRRKENFYLNLINIIK
jgi:probable rRNA maturation factor